MSDTCPPPPCKDFEWLAAVLHVALRPLYELHVDPKILFAIARRIAVKWYWYPFAEGMICEGPENKVCSIYRMFYKCMSEDGRETFAMIEMDDDPDYGLDIHGFTDIELSEKDVEELQPKKPVLTVEVKESEEERACLEQVKKELASTRNIQSIKPSEHNKMSDKPVEGESK